ncbi:MAG: tetratricopeptide repeat protein, partial [Promethearchaeota archaeon]
AHNPHNHSLMQLVWIKIEFHQFEKAQELIETAKKNDLNDPYIYNSLGDLKRYQQDTLGSINAYTNAIEMNPYEPLFWKNLALMYMQIGEFKQAQVAIDELMILDPDKIDPWITYAWLYEEKNEFENAILKIKEGLEKIPKCAELYIELARCYNEIGDGLGEFKFLQKAREVSPQNVNVLNGLAYYFLNNDDYEASEEIFQQILKIDTANITALNGLATLKYEEHHDPSSAENYLKQSIEIDPTNLQTWIQYGQLIFHEEKYIEAEKYFKKALEINPQHISVLHYLGLIAWGIHGDLKQAESYFKQGLSFESDNISISLDLIELYRTDLKQIDKAKEITKNLLEILPDDKYLKEILKTLR